ncbi:glycine--tRNA ligase [Desulfobacter latus]|uniref:Glycine--tRNA ligase n=1 Tax=Desulfobacter latus TaxID=2292 RepID=A0A850T613_9BACT|nr:glycine--tRNA ligase [Desulfobacter latus]NWH03758.1 glycine--tRNA ligase [Desulfobacter latus]
MAKPKKEATLMDKVVGLCKRRGFVYPGSEIYGGLANAWDFGPLGVELLKNLKEAWWKKFVTERIDMVGLDAAILMNPTTWEASGHVGSFADPLMDCKKCKSRERADKLVENWQQANGSDEQPANWAGEKTPPQDMLDFINAKKIACPQCGSLDWTLPKAFNLMFKTQQGVVEGEGKDIYLRPETAQGIFVNFKNVHTTSRKKIPFGIAQIGKAFRNEITPGNFVFRTREFEQMEIEYFCKPGTELEYHDFWKTFCMDWYLGLGVTPDNLRFRDHDDAELSHYSNATSDIEYRYPFGWGELCGIASRTNYDLRQHMEYSAKDLKYFDEAAKEKYIPFVIEPSLGVQRSALVFLCDAYEEEEIKEGDTRVVLHLHNQLAPVKIAVMPLAKKIADNAKPVFDTLVQQLGLNMDFDVQGSIGKRYRRQDEAGTPYCVTFDYDSLDDNAVTVRERDSMDQQRIKIDELVPFFREKFTY